jgi:L,D-transpeptidase ErfK/SrfK
MSFRLLTILLATTLPLPATAEQFELPPDGHDVIGAVAVVAARADDTLLDIARRHGLGYEDIVRANPDVDTWLPGEGTEVLLPTRYVLPPVARKGVVLNLAEYRMYYFPEREDGHPAIVMTYPMSIGRMDWETPLGTTRVVAKATNPAWYPPESVRAEHAADGDPLPRVVPPGPKNPLGAYALRLGLPGYLIHSTNRPAGVGMRVSHGCIRMFPEDIGFLFDRISVNTPVRIINEPVKVGWDGDELVMEVHRTLEVSPIETDSGEIRNELLSDVPPAQPGRNVLTALTEQFVAATNTRAGELDWERAEILLERADGIPVPVGRTIKNAATSAASE